MSRVGAQFGYKVHLHAWHEDLICCSRLIISPNTACVLILKKIYTSIIVVQFSTGEIFINVLLCFFVLFFNIFTNFCRSRKPLFYASVLQIVMYSHYSDILHACSYGQICKVYIELLFCFVSFTKLLCVSVEFPHSLTVFSVLWYKNSSNMGHSFPQSQIN